jgi:hypothetical protein
MSAALARAGGAAASSEGRCPRISKSRFRIAAPASGLASAARPSASRSRDICETPTGDASVTASALESMASSAGAIAAMTCVFAVPEAVKFEPSAASPNGRACITGSTKLVAPSNAAPAASSNAERPEASTEGVWDAFAGSSAPPACTSAHVCATRVAAALAAATGTKHVHSLVISIRRARCCTHTSLSSSKVSYSCSHSSPADSGHRDALSPAATPPPRTSQCLAVSSSATTAPSGNVKRSLGGSFTIFSSGLTKPFGSSAPAARRMPGHAATAAPSVSSVGYLVRPSRASRNATLSCASGSTCRWLDATAAAVSVSRTT